MHTDPAYRQGSFEQPVSVGNWLITLIVLAIPVVNLIMYLVWAFSDGTPASKQNFARASLILMAAGLALGLLFGLGGVLSM